ncbi:MAG: topoisomerase DNA-binding C4 zinc finger domain-containing protein [Coriobacteriia bacterium]|nr:topoisomerase DNA-binding C4 zinc finger domain-containing protein [Coriobacteriia bacterium]
MPAPRTAPVASQVSKAPHVPAAPPVVATRPDSHPVASRPNCPRCGIPMVPRTAKRGAHAGRTFYGCVNFPRCRQTRAIERPDGSPVARNHD